MCDAQARASKVIYSESMFQIQRSPEVHDVVVIGSGAGGGTVVKVLTDRGNQRHAARSRADAQSHEGFQGAHVALPGGPSRRRDRTPRCTSESRRGRSAISRRPTDTGTSPASRTRSRRTRSSSGSARASWAAAPITTAASRCAFPITISSPTRSMASARDWPVTYDEMSPYYDKAEEFIGVTGTKEGLRTAPDGKFLPPIAPRVHETLIQKACQKLNIPCIPSRMAMLTKSIHGRAACHYCGQCGRGCHTASAFTSSQAMIFPAMKTGKLQRHHRRHGARADHRRYRQSHGGLLRREGHAHRKEDPLPSVVVAASACESARLLLNSKSPRFPNGLANDSGMVGRNLTDTTGYDLGGYVPALANLPRHNSDGIGGMHVYVPWWLLDEKNKDFPRGYHIEVGGGFDMPRNRHLRAWPAKATARR